MEHVTIEPPVQKTTPPSQQFVDSASLKSYAQATTVLTLVINLVLYVYNVIESGVMPNKLLLPIAIILSVLYVLTFFKRDPANTVAQYWWITALNSIMLFTSISGANSMLDSARKSFVANNEASLKTASVGDFFVHVLFPTHGWFSTKKIEFTPEKREVVSITNSLDTTQKFIQTLLAEKKNDIVVIDGLHKKVDSLQTNYIVTLDAFSRIQASYKFFQDSLRRINPVFQPSVELAQLSPEIQTDIRKLRQDQQAQKQVQIEQVQQQQQQVQRIEQKQLQIQQQQQQIQQIQRRSLLEVNRKVQQ